MCYGLGIPFTLEHQFTSNAFNPYLIARPTIKETNHGSMLRGLPEPNFCAIIFQAKRHWTSLATRSAEAGIINQETSEKLKELY